MLGSFFMRLWKSDFQWHLYKSAFHAAGGAVCGLATLLMPQVWITLAGFGIMFTVILIKEIREDKVTQDRKKTIRDVCAWVIGFWIFAWVKFL